MFNKGSANPPCGPVFRQFANRMPRDVRPRARGGESPQLLEWLQSFAWNCAGKVLIALPELTTRVSIPSQFQPIAFNIIQPRISQVLIAIGTAKGRTRRTFLRGVAEEATATAPALT